MYRGGKICLDIHFAPLWAKMSPKYGIAHALALAVSNYFFIYNFILTIQLGPWLAAEVPYLAENGIIGTEQITKK